MNEDVVVVGKTYPPVEWNKVAVVLRYPVHPSVPEDAEVTTMEMPLKSFVNVLKQEGLL